jgi:hypothetical protein
MRTNVLWIGFVVAAIAVPPSVWAGPLFEDQGDKKLGTQPCGGRGCWTNYARVSDLDADGDLDLVGVNAGGFFAKPVPQPLAVWLNDGTGNFTDGSALFGGFVGAVRQVAVGDIDADGDLDVYLPAAGSTQPDSLFVHRESETWTDEASARLPKGMSSDAGAARFGDADGDGDLDLFVASGYIDTKAIPLRLYLNDGQGRYTTADGQLPTEKRSAINPDDIDLADIDGDFDLDVYINMHSGQNLLWINDGKGAFTDVSARLPPLSTAAKYHYGPVFCDIDGDHDRDLFIDNTAGDYTEQLLVNDGSGNFNDQTETRVAGNTKRADDNLVACIDYDGDDDLDIAIAALSPGQERLFQNDGSGKFTMVANAFDGPVDPTLWMEFGDLNGDGRLDAFTAQGEGYPQTERVYFGTAAVDRRAPRIIAIEPVSLSATADTVVHFAIVDNAVTDDGPRLRRAWIVAGSREIEAHFVGGDLYRALVPATTETKFAVCATDWAGNTISGCE